MRVHVALLVLLLAVLGAALHPLVLLVGLVPFDTSGLINVLNILKSVIGDLFGWGLVSILGGMLALVVSGRVSRRRDALPQDARPGPAWGDQRPRVAVVITAYNDAEATAQTVADFRVRAEVSDIIVVDNNCTDNTAALARAAGATVVHEPLQGYGYACMRGLAEATKLTSATLVVLTEGDGTFVAADLDKFLAYAGQAEMVVGTRVVNSLVERGSQMDYFFTWGNIAVATLLRLRFWDTQYLGVTRLTDVGCTYRAIHRDALERILPDLVVGGMHFSPHMILVALERRLSVIEIPITFRRRTGQSKGASQSVRKGLVVGLAMIWHILFFSPGSAPTPALPRSATERAA